MKFFLVNLLLLCAVTISHAQTFHSAFGKRKKILLPDRTTVILNSNTTLSLDAGFGKTNRGVALDGDGYFEIKKSTRQFVIRTPHLIISSRAAVVKVTSYQGDAGEETLLRSGSARIVKSYFSKLDAEPYFLAAGDMLMMNRDIDLMEKEKFDSADLDDWLGERIIFQNATADVFIKRLEKLYNARVEVTGNMPQKIRFSGNFRKDDLQQVLLAAAGQWHFRFEVRKNTLLMKF